MVIENLFFCGVTISFRVVSDTAKVVKVQINNRHGNTE
jgi:hypothetical protein